MIFEKDFETRENIIYNFEPNQQIEAIKQVLVNKFKEKRRNSLQFESDEESLIGTCPLILEQHISSLPSPPMEEKKVEEIISSSQEIKDKIEILKQEKHELFQLLKQLMLKEHHSTASYF